MMRIKFIQLKHLNLSNNNLGDDGIQILSSIIGNT